MSSVSSALALEECELSQNEASVAEVDLLAFTEAALNEKPVYFSLLTPKTNVAFVTGTMTVSF